MESLSYCIYYHNKEMSYCTVADMIEIDGCLVWYIYKMKKMI